MKRYIKTAVVLALICAVAAILLAVVNNVTAPYIAKYEEEKETLALKEVANGFEIGEKSSFDDTYVSYAYPLYSKGELCGYILGLNTRGYGGDIVLLAGYDLNGAVTAVTIVSDSETPGVGKKAHNEGYMDKFIGKGSDKDPLPTSKSTLSETDSVAISGATMTFSGISSALKAGSDFIKATLSSKNSVSAKEALK